MTSYLKWAVPGGALLLILGAVIGARVSSHSGDLQAQKPQVDITSASRYPAPTISIVSQPFTREMNSNLRHSSSQYGSDDGSDRSSRRSRKRHKKSAPKADVAKADTASADPDLGFMAADDPKLKKAESEASAGHASGGGDDVLLKPVARG